MCVIPVIDDLLHYGPPTRSQAYCRVRLFATEIGQVALFTELKENPGKSIVNAAEEVVAAAIMRFQLDPERTTFLDHFGKASYERWNPGELPRYSRVELGPSGASWTPFPLDMVKALLGDSAIKE